MEFIDIHTHILPAVDDGAQTLEESLALLEEEKKQGITHVAVTPHFSPYENDMDEHISAAENALRLLKAAAAGKDLPRVILGCEVLYFYGIGSAEDISRLALRGTPYILIEFGGVAFDDQICDDLLKIKERYGLVPIIAHTERYKDHKGYKKLLKTAERGGFLIQVNAGSVLGGVYRRAAHKLIKKGTAHLIASDCHSVSGRPPQIKQALAEIESRFGRHAATRLLLNSQKLAEETDKITGAQ